jgi:hypothetical protein
MRIGLRPFLGFQLHPNSEFVEIAGLIDGIVFALCGFGCSTLLYPFRLPISKESRVHHVRALIVALT